MAVQKSSLNLPKQSLVKLAVCAGILVAFVALLILPNIMEDKQVKRDVLQIKADIEKQKILYPIYIKLMAELKNKVVQELPIPEPEQLTEDKVDAAIHAVENMAMESDLRINEVTPDPMSLAKSEGYVGLNCDFYGDFMDIRSFLTQLGSLPYLRHIEQINLQEGADGVNYTLRLQLAVKTGA